MRNFNMVSIEEKPATWRFAIASGKIIVGHHAFELISNQKLPKGDAITLANIAGIIGAKSATNIMPLCHPIPIEHIKFEFEFCNDEFSIIAYCAVITNAKTGVEMEALSGVNSALLNIWDVTKMINPNLEITNIRLLAKFGGKSSFQVESMPQIAKNIIESELRCK